jgi:hypothetical protein
MDIKPQWMQYQLDQSKNLYKIYEETKDKMNLKYRDGAGGRDRTDTESLPRDFESRASTNFTTPATIEIRLSRKLFERRTGPWGLLLQPLDIGLGAIPPERVWLREA